VKQFESTVERQRAAPRVRFALVVALLLTSALLVQACRSQEHASAPPAGYWLAGDASAMREILIRFEALEGTPIAAWAESVRSRLADCSTFHARTDEKSASTLVDAIACDVEPIPNQELTVFRSGDSLAFAIPIAGPGRLVGRLKIDATGSIRGDARLEVLPEVGFASLLVPGSEPAGAPALSTRDILVHARLRPAAGLDLAAWIDPETQADAMFRLRSQIFLSGILDGAWEIGIYTPDSRQLTPPIALALDTSQEELAAAAMERFVAELEETWPIHHRAFRFGESKGACIVDLHILPDLMPCYVVAPQRLVVGWNPVSIRAALGIGTEPPSAVLGEEGGLVVFLDRLPSADRILREQLGHPLDEGPVDYVWRRLRLEGRPDGAGLDIHLELDAPAAS
jgi:hypothetical protein